MRHIVALSGGKDSTAMALRLKEVEPDTDFVYVCTPTGNELPEMFAHWRTLGDRLGSRILPVTSGLGFEATCAVHGALPNFRMRFCTRDLKIAPFKKFAYANAPCTLYVGLRADEPEREGVDYGKGGGEVYGGIEGVTQRYPLREWGWGMADVLDYLHKADVTVPKRTDCAFCFFQRLAEWWRLWREHPALFEEAIAMEKEFAHTFRTPGKDSWPTALADLRAEFEKGRVPHERLSPEQAGQLTMFTSSDRQEMCRVCRL